MHHVEQSTVFHRVVLYIMQHMAHDGTAYKALLHIQTHVNVKNPYYLSPIHLFSQ